VNARFVNDCSDYHVGCQVVAREIRRKLDEVGMVEAEPAERIIVNGEGALHHDSPNVEHIREAVRARPDGSRLIVLNTVWQGMKRNLEGVNLAVARESRSGSAMRESGLSPRVLVAPDISLCCQHRPVHQGGGGLVVIDSVWDRVSGWLAEVAREHDARFVKMCDWNESPEALIDLLASADAVVTGRFHGSIFAMLAGAPFITAPSNTWKTEGMLQDFGMGEFHCKTKDDVQASIASSRFARFDRRKLEAIEKQWSSIFEEIKTSDEPQRQTIPVSKPEKTTSAPVQTVWTAVKTVVLVGNGPSVQASGLGRIIDAHDEVVRFNAYRLKEFEADVGTKTTLWSTFGKGMVPADSAPPRRAICVHEAATPSGEPVEVFRIPRSFYAQMQQEIRAISLHKRAASVNPTSGFLVIRWLLENGCPKLHLAGFDHFSKIKRKQHHYWDPKASGRPADHDGDAERHLLLPLAEAGRLVYLT